MNANELNNFISGIEKQYTSNEAYIGFHYNDEDEYSNHIKANKEGLLLYANQLLKASLEFEKNTSNAFVFEIAYEVDMTHSAFYFSHIELLNTPKSELKKPKEHKQTFREQVGCFIAIVIGLFILVCLLVGVYTVFSSIF